MSEELKRIKKRYGERMMHLCRDLFPTILNEPNRLTSILDSTFGHPKYLYDDIVNKDLKESFKNFIYYLYDGEYKKISTNKKPFQLMDDVGYALVECKTNEDIMQFKKYYSKDEELCTFKDKRLESNYVFFAVKKNVDEIIREQGGKACPKIYWDKPSPDWMRTIKRWAAPSTQMTSAIKVRLS